MAQKDIVQDPLATDEEAELVDQFAAFAKSYFIYPETNNRVQESIELFLNGVSAYSKELKALEISVRPDHLRTASGRLDSDKPILEWLRNSLVTTVLAGLRLENGMTQDGLMAFLARLRENTALRGKEKHRDFTFAELWPEEYPGVVLREHVFVGGYHDNSVSMGLSDDGREIATVRAAVDMTTSEGVALAETIEASEAVLERIRRIEGILQSRGVQDAPEMSLDLLGEIVHHLPAEAVTDHSYAEKYIEEILETLEPIISGLVWHGTSSEDQDEKHKVGRVLATIISDFFGGQAASGPDEMERGPEIARPGDELVTDDVDACLEQLEELSDVEFNLNDRDPFAAAEILGACLHRLTNCPRDASARRIYDEIGSLLKTPDVEVPFVLAGYSDALLGEESDKPIQRAAERVLDHLRSCGLLGKIRDLGALPVDSLVFAFPRGFLLFVDSLDPTKQSHREQLQEICFKVGDPRIRREEPVLIAEGGILRLDRATKILSCSSPDVLPLARIIARHGGRPLRDRLVNYLISLEVDRPEAVALRVLEPTDRIPEGYLIDLCEGELNAGKYKKKMLPYTGFLICNYIESLGDAEECFERRAYAILTLKDFPGETTDELLSKLVKGRGPLGLRKAPKAIRDAVARVRSQLRTRK